MAHYSDACFLNLMNVFNVFNRKNNKNAPEINRRSKIADKTEQTTLALSVALSPGVFPCRFVSKERASVWQLFESCWARTFAGSSSNCQSDSWVWKERRRVLVPLSFRSEDHVVLGPFWQGLLIHLPAPLFRHFTPTFSELRAIDNYLENWH